MFEVPDISPDDLRLLEEEHDRRVARGDFRGPRGGNPHLWDDDPDPDGDGDPAGEPAEDPEDEGWEPHEHPEHGRGLRHRETGEEVYGDQFDDDGEPDAVHYAAGGPEPVPTVAAPAPAAPAASPPTQLRPARPTQVVNPPAAAPAEARGWRAVATASGRQAWHNPHSGAVVYRPRPPLVTALDHARAQHAREVAPPETAPHLWSDPAGATAALERMFGEGRPDLARAHELAGGLPGARYHLSGGSRVNPHELYVSLDRAHHLRHHDRKLELLPNGDLEVSNNLFFLRKKHQGKGLGLESVRSQVQRLHALGADRIRTYAGRGRGVNGYKDWPKMGYDAMIPTHLRHRLPDALNRASTVQELYDLPGGPAWWAEHGESLPLTFDLRPGSRSLRVMNRYLAAKGKEPIREVTPEHYGRLRAEREARLAAYAPPPAPEPASTTYRPEQAPGVADKLGWFNRQMERVDRLAAPPTFAPGQPAFSTLHGKPVRVVANHGSHYAVLDEESGRELPDWVHHEQLMPVTDPHTPPTRPRQAPPAPYARAGAAAYDEHGEAEHGPEAWLEPPRAKARAPKAAPPAAHAPQAPAAPAAAPKAAPPAAHAPAAPPRGPRPPAALGPPPGPALPEAPTVGPPAADEFPAAPPSPADRREAVYTTLSANTGSIPGLKRLNDDAAAGDPQAAHVLSNVAHDALSYLTGGLDGVKVTSTPALGLYGGDLEASLGSEVAFPERHRPAVLAALARFARNFNQEQVHVRASPEPNTPEGHAYPDGSYNTPVLRLDLHRPLSRGRVEEIVRASGLYGLTATPTHLETYYAGDPRDHAAVAEFERAAQRAADAAGGDVRAASLGAARLWVYGRGDGAIPYGRIAGDVPLPDPRDNPAARRIAARLAGREVRGVPAEKAMTPAQAQLHTEIAHAYEGMRTNALSDPLVKKAYQELAGEVRHQYEHLPVKVEIRTGQSGEPYPNSRAMRHDVLANNHLYIYGTTPETFGPPGVAYDGHPLLDDSGLTDVNGRPLLNNDLLRAVHDYYAHTLTPAQFGPLGEEAAWRNHMAMTRSPLARWALTSETRGQNSWVNFGPLAEANRADPKNTTFAEQKVDLLPVRYAMTGDPDLDRELLDAARAQGHGREEAERYSRAAEADWLRDVGLRYAGAEGPPAAAGQAAAAPAPPFHSRLEHALKGLGPKPLPANAVYNRVKKAGVPDEEWHATKMPEALQGKPQVTPQELLAHYGANKVMPGEVWKANPDEVRRRFQLLERRRRNLLAGEFPPQEEAERERLLQLLHGGGPGISPTKYDGYQTPGGENYREMLLTLPVKDDPDKEIERLQAEQSLIGNSANYTPGGIPHEALERLSDLDKQISAARRRREQLQPYKSPHWDEPNVIAHARMHDRTGPNGEKGLHVEEVQSDLHQAGREAGYGPPRGAGELPRGWRVEKRHNPLTGRESFFVYDDRGDKRGTWGQTEEEAIRDATLSLPQPVPDMPYKDSWPTLALKRLLHHAAEQGHDRLTLNSGKQIQSLVGGEGEGQGEFYDQILPNILAKLGKPHGVKPEPHHINTETEEERGQREGRAARFEEGVRSGLYVPDPEDEGGWLNTATGETFERPVAVPKTVRATSLRITPEMRRSILATGFPHMEEGGEAPGGPTVLAPGETVRPAPWKVPQVPGSTPGQDSVLASLRRGDVVEPVPHRRRGAPERYAGPGGEKPPGPVKNDPPPAPPRFQHSLVPKAPAPAKPAWPGVLAGVHPVVSHVEALPPPAHEPDHWPSPAAYKLDQYLGGHRGLPGMRGYGAVPELSDYLHARHAAGDLPRDYGQAQALARLAEDASEIGGPHLHALADHGRPLSEALARHGGFLTRLRRPVRDDDPYDPAWENDPLALPEGVAAAGEYVPRRVGDRHEWFFDRLAPQDEALPPSVGRDTTHTLPRPNPGDVPGARPLGPHPPGRLQNRELTKLERVLAGLDDAPGLDRDDPQYRALLDAHRHGDESAGLALGDYLKEGGHLPYRRGGPPERYSGALSEPSPAGGHPSNPAPQATGKVPPPPKGAGSHHGFLAHVRALPPAGGYEYPQVIADRFAGPTGGLPKFPHWEVPGLARYLADRHAAGDLPRDVAQAEAVLRLAQDAGDIPWHRTHFAPGVPLAQALARHARHTTRLHAPLPMLRDLARVYRPHQSGEGDDGGPWVWWDDGLAARQSPPPPTVAEVGPYEYRHGRELTPEERRRAGIDPPEAVAADRTARELAGAAAADPDAAGPLHDYLEEMGYRRAAAAETYALAGDAGDRTPLERRRARLAGLVVLPDERQGARCGNCQYFKPGRLSPKNGDCRNGAVRQPVTSRHCCDHWDAPGAKHYERPPLPERVEAAAAEVHPEPTDAQREAGNYRMGHITISGLDITIEVPPGGIRSGKSKDGREWSVTMRYAYGYIRRLRN